MIRALPALLLAWSIAPAQGRKCGTAAWMERPAAARLAKRADDAPPYRTLSTEHFLIRYCLAGADQVRLAPEDAGLAAARDSLYAALGGAPGMRRADSAVLAALDAASAPHPLYARTAARLLEEAWSGYVDGLGMRKPIPARGKPPYYGAPAAGTGKYPVDIADLGNVEPRGRAFPIYGYTFDWNGLYGMAIENDFLYLASLGPDGKPRGTPITSEVDFRTLHDYSVEWEAGLAVTCFHEFYHSVQFAYTPEVDDFHVWYEASATAMEERMAPEVDDYLQYIDDLFRTIGRTGMLSYDPQGFPTYGNAAYHLFLAGELGPRFDDRLWARLSANGNRLADALERALDSAGNSPGKAHVRYAARLAYSGTPFKGPYPAFTSDLPRWPRLWMDTADLRQGSPALGSQPPLSVRALALTGLREGGKALFLRDSILKPVLLRLRGDSAAPEFPAARILPLDPGPGADDFLILLLVNGSMDRSGSAEIAAFSSKADTAVYAYPNPAERSSGAAFFSRLTRASSASIHAEDGRLVRALDFSPQDPAWSWDLADARGIKVKPGLYWYRVDGGAPRPLYVK